MLIYRFLLFIFAFFGLLLCQNQRSSRKQDDSTASNSSIISIGVVGLNNLIIREFEPFAKNFRLKEIKKHENIFNNINLGETYKTEYILKKQKGRFWLFNTYNGNLEQSWRAKQRDFFHYALLKILVKRKSQQAVLAKGIHFKFTKNNSRLKIKNLPEQPLSLATIYIIENNLYIKKGLQLNSREVTLALQIPKKTKFFYVFIYAKRDSKQQFSCLKQQIDCQSFLNQHQFVIGKKLLMENEEKLSQINPKFTSPRTVYKVNNFMMKDVLCSYKYIKTKLANSLQGNHYKIWNDRLAKIKKKLAPVLSNKRCRLNTIIYPSPTFNASICSYDHIFISSQVIKRYDYYKKKIPTLSREEYLTPILAHEMAHCNLGHLNTDPESAKQKQKREVDADRESFSMIFYLYGQQRTKKILTNFFKILNQERGKVYANKKRRLPSFTDSHPSPAYRALMNRESIDGQLRKYLFWVYKLEKISEKIKYGSEDLEKYCRILSEEIKQVKINIELSKKKAICFHKAWLQSLKPSEIKMLPYLHSELFSNAYKYSDNFKYQIPGDFQLFLLAFHSYENYLQYDSEPVMLSNFSILLFYKQGYQKIALGLAENMASKHPGFYTYLNYAILLYKSGKQRKCKIIFQDKLKQYATSKKQKYLLYINQSVTIRNKSLLRKIRQKLSNEKNAIWLPFIDYQIRNI